LDSNATMDIYKGWDNNRQVTSMQKGHKSDEGWIINVNIATRGKH
jgi:hypothetical protein